MPFVPAGSFGVSTYTISTGNEASSLDRLVLRTSGISTLPSSSFAGVAVLPLTETDQISASFGIVRRRNWLRLLRTL